MKLPPLWTQILENNTLKKLGKGRVDEITLIEHRRAHNISIELSGIKLSFEEIKVWEYQSICHVLCCAEFYRIMHCAEFYRIMHCIALR